MELKNVIKNIKTIHMTDSLLSTLINFERVLNNIDLYAFKNWKKGELVQGPDVKKHWVSCTFMWPYKDMPDPDGGKRLLGYNAIVTYQKDTLKTPVKITSNDDFEPGTRKAKLQEDPVWLVTIRLPKELIDDTAKGSIELEGKVIDTKEVEETEQENIDDLSSNDANKADEGIAPEADELDLEL